MSTSGGKEHGKGIRLGVLVEVDEYPEERVVTLVFDDAAAKEWANNLNLLKHARVNSLALTSSRSAFTLHVLRHVRDVGTVRAWATWAKDELTVQLTPTELEYWSEFFNTYSETGQGPVDHIDVETAPAPPGKRRPTTLVLKLPKADTPVSAEEAARRLGRP